MKTKKVLLDRVVGIYSKCLVPYCHQKAHFYYCTEYLGSTIFKTWCKECKKESQQHIKRMLSSGWIKVKRKKVKKLKKKIEDLKDTEKIMNS